MKKQVFVIAILALLSLSILSAFVSAQQTNFGAASQTIAQSLNGFFNGIKINPQSTTTILLGILLWIVIYSIVTKLFSFEGRFAWLWGGVVALIVVILTFIYIPANTIEAIALQYTAVGATILTVIPFIILVYFTISVSKSLFIARTVWIVYIGYYFSIFIYKAASSSNGFFTADNIPYFGAILAGIVVLVLLGFMREKVFSAKIESKEEKAMKGVKIREAGRKVIEEEAKSVGISES